MQALWETVIALHCASVASEPAHRRRFLAPLATPSGIVLRPSRSTFLRSIVVWRRTRRLPQVEGVVLNALAEARGFAAGYLCLRRAKLHRLAAAGRSTLLALYLNPDSVRLRTHDAVKIRPLTSPKPTR
jgi:hypothetical protein